MTNAVEIRSYHLKPGPRHDFHRLMMQQALPMLRRWNVDVVACEPSPHDADSYYLVRAYRDLKEREARQEAFSTAATNGAARRALRQPLD